MQGESLISAQVVLRSRTEKVAGGSDVVTSDTVGDYEPAPETAARAAESFERLGFTVGPVVGSSFSISAPRKLFEDVFKTDIAAALRRRAKAKPTRRAASNELPLDRLPTQLAALVTAVTFTPPPDFGPGSFS